MRFPPELERELEPFIRWMAITPQLFREYRTTQGAVMRSARLSPEASEWLQDAGLTAVVELVRKKFDEICGDNPSAWQRTEFTRDRTIGGYGGVVKSSKPD